MDEKEMEMRKNEIIAYVKGLNLSMHGHASFSVYAFTKDGVYNEPKFRGGILPFALSHLEVTLDSQEEFKEYYDNLIGKEHDNYRRNYYAMQPYGDDNCYTVSHYLGHKPGKLGTDVFTLPPSDPSKPMRLFVWDDGHGGLQIPDNCNSVLWMSDKVLPDREQFAKITQECRLILGANVLRSAGAMISRQISWERTVTDLMWQLKIMMPYPI